jgi:potassium-dependent mechanosensitive channel
MPQTRILIILSFLALLSSPLWGQEPVADPTPPPATVTAEEITRAQELLQADSSLEPATREAAAALYTQALDSLRRAEEMARQRAEYDRLASESPQLLATIREELSKPAGEVVIKPPEGATLQQLESLATQAATDLESARRTAQELQNETSRRNDRSTAITTQLGQLRDQIQSTKEALLAAPSAGEPAVVTQARRLQLLARSQALSREIETLEAESASYDARRDLLPARRDRGLRRVAEAEKAAAGWQELVGKRRQREADAAAQEAKRLRLEAARQHPALQVYALENERLATERTGPTGLTSRIANATQAISSNRSLLATLRDDFEAIWRRVQASGLNRATGLLLRRQFETLKDPNDLHRQLRLTRQQLEDAEYMLVEYQDQRLAAGDIDRAVSGLLQQFEEDIGEADRDAVRQIALELATARRDLLDQLVADSGTLFERLAELDLVTFELLTATEAYLDFIEERILWVRSIAGDQLPQAGDFAAAVSWALDPVAWPAAIRYTASATMSRLPAVTLLTLAVALTFLLARGARKRMAAYAALVNSYRTDRLRYTFLVLLLTLFCALPIPLTIVSIGWVLSRPTEQVGVALALAAGLQLAGLLTYPLFVLRQVVRKSGLAEAHFRWQQPTVRLLRRHLRWFLAVIVPVVVLVIAFDEHADEAQNASLGRLVFTVGLLALALFAHRLVRPSGVVLEEFLRRHRGGWVDRLRYVWYPLVLGVPGVLIVLAWLGYYYTAMQFQQRFDRTLLLGMVLVITYATFSRWLFVARRRMAVEEARRRREQAATEAEERPGAELMGEAGIPAIEEHKLDLPAISAQTKQLFRAATGVAIVIGFYAIWADVLPALRMLDRVQIWPRVQVIEQLDREASVILVPLAGGETIPVDRGSSAMTPTSTSSAVEAAGTTTGSLTDSLTDSLSPAPPDGESPVIEEAVSLADVGLALIVLIATVIAFRNLPGFIEIVILQKLPLDAGNRYALTTVLRYIIVIVGLIVAFDFVGLTWSKVQWLAAALTFGLAFGLQEIFANFISGLIMLGERPVRVGDTVTVGAITGTVTRIRMRATTISDWDRKELVIPNKNFITGDVINWTLSDPVLRVTVPVGVSYSSDVDKVTSLLLEIAEVDSIVLTDPKPRALFLGFGDSTLNFELRVFIPHIDYYVAVRHEMHMSIMKRFREAGIEIAFPQRDLHVRSIGDFAKLVEKRAELPPEETR